MSRVQLALNVADLESSVAFYSTMFGTAPHKLRPGYANFQITEPPLKLVLIETTEEARGAGVNGALNHLGVEVDTSGDVHAALGRLQEAGLAVSEELDTTCCYSQQDKVWVHDPAGAPWEVYTITDDNPASTEDMEFVGRMNDGACCTPESTAHSVPSVEAVPTSAVLGSTTTVGACC
ncbi:MAG: VOC family protein [Actinobacteria bacterium]|nr:VOC family protein [Actinomycetota bacterium]